jgi:hypothetical protein
MHCQGDGGGHGAPEGGVSQLDASADGG